MRDVDVVGDDGGEEGVACQLPGGGHGDGTDPGDLAHLAGVGVASYQGGVVDADDDLRPRPDPSAGRPGDGGCFFASAGVGGSASWLGAGWAVPGAGRLAARSCGDLG